MRSLPPIIRALIVFAVVAATSLSCAAVLGRHLPANRTSAVASALILATVVLAIGGPIIGLFLAIGHYRRITRDPTLPPLLMRALFDADAGTRRKYVGILILLGIGVGLSLLTLGLVMLVPAAWGASGGDMPPGVRPADLQGERMIFYGVIAIGIAGAGLLLVSLVAGLILLSTGGPRGK